MKITVVNGQSHKGSTYHIGKMLADKLGGKVTEYFLPKDFSDMCIGCTSCFIKNEHLCPHHARLEKLTNAIDDADVLIFTSPVYVYHTTGAMKSFLDHYGYRWMVHRPEKKMFSKQAVCISTAAGAGTKSTNKDIADSFFFWGIPKIYKYGECPCHIIQRNQRKHFESNRQKDHRPCKENQGKGRQGEGRNQDQSLF